VERDRLNELIEELLKEHREFLKILAGIESDLAEGVSTETLYRLLEVMEVIRREALSIIKLVKDHFQQSVEGFG